MMCSGRINAHALLLPRCPRREAGEIRRSDYGKMKLAEALGPVSPTRHLIQTRAVNRSLVRQMARGEIRGKLMLESAD